MIDQWIKIWCWGMLLGGIAHGASLSEYVEQFNADDDEWVETTIPNREALAFLEKNVPLFECPDEGLERTYAFRWWTFRKHVRKTPDGFVVTEFLPDVPWARKHNTICCPAGHQFREGRWLHDRRILDDYARFYFGGGGKPRQYSFWAADSILQFCHVSGDYALATELLDRLVENYHGWETSRLTDDGLFWQIDDRDGMEVSIGGSGKRATINSYMYGDAVAIAVIARMAGRNEVAGEFSAKAEKLRGLINNKLWCGEHAFYKTLPYAPEGQAFRNAPACGAAGGGEWVNVRELHGYTPWYFHVPVQGGGHEVAWRHLMDDDGFQAPFGPTSAEQRHPGFKVSREGHDCQWNGPSWPFATSVTLTAMANALHDYPLEVIDKADYFKVLKTYAASHRLKREDGREVSWIDENLDPKTGEWLARSLLKERSGGDWSKKGSIQERGKDYNHSTFCDLVITGLMGLRVRADDTVVVQPLIPEGEWDWCRLSDIPYRGHRLTIQWDRDGKRFGNGAGLQVIADGEVIARSDQLSRVTGELP